MPGTYKYSMEIESNVKQLLSDMKEAQDKLDALEGKEYTIKLNIDEKKLGNVISNLEKMLDSLGKGTGDFKQLENLSNELSSIATEVQSLSKAFGKVDDSGAKTLLSSIQNIDKSLSELSQNILNVNKNMGNMGSNTNGAVEQVKNIGNAAADTVKQVDKLADAQSKLGGNKTNPSSGLKDAIQGGDTSTSVQKIADNFQEIKQETDKATESAEKYKRVLSQVGELGVDSKVSAMYERNDGQLESVSWRARRDDQGQIIYDKNGSIDYDINSTVISKYEQLEKIIIKADDELRDLQKTLSDTQALDPTASTTNIEKQIQYQKDYIQLLEHTVKAISQQNEYLLYEQQIIAARNKAENEYNLKQGTKSDVTNAKANVKASKIESLEKQKEIIKQLTTALDDYSSVQTKIAKGLGTDEDANEAERLLNIIHDLQRSDILPADKLSESNKKLIEIRENAEKIKLSNDWDKAIAINKNFDDVGSLPKYKELSSELENVKNKISEYNQQLVNGEIVLSDYNKKTGDLISSYKELAKVQENRDFEEYNQSSKDTKINEKLRSKGLNYTKKASERLKNAISKYSYGDTSDAKSMMQQMNNGWLNFKDLSKVEDNIKNFELTIQNITADLKRSHEESLNALNKEIKADSQHQSQKDSFNKSNLNAIDMEIKKREEEAKLFSNSLKAQMEAEAKQKKENESAIEKYSKRLESYDKKTTGFDATIARFEDGGWTSDSYTQKVNAIKAAVKDYKDTLNEMKANPNLVTQEQIDNLNKQEKTIKENTIAIQNMSAAEKGYTLLSGQKAMDKINKILKDNSAMSREAKNQIKAWYAEIASGNPTKDLSQILGEVQKIVNAEAEAGRSGKSMIDVIKDKAWYGLAGTISTYFGLNDIIRYGQQAAGIVKDLNTQITELAKVSEQSSSQIYNDFDSYAEIAKKVRGTISDTIAATADWSKNGYSIPDAKELAEVSQLYKNVGDGINIDEANESLISTLKGFKLEADQAEHIVDVFNEVSNNEPISSAGIGDALQRSAASFNAANTSLEQSVALVTATRLHRLVECMETYIKNIFNCHRSLYYYVPQYRGNYYMMV